MKIMYKKNPKTDGSGVICCIPQRGKCPNNCPDCFFQSGRSFLKPLDENLPNIPTDVKGRIVRMNDGNDSNINQKLVMEVAKQFPMKFYNTSMNRDLDNFDAPFVLTVNPGEITDIDYHNLNYIPKNLMMVRARVNTWNLKLIDKIVKHYTKKEIPIILTFMAYFNESIPFWHRNKYVFRKRTLNSYWAITTKAWEKIMKRYKYNKYVYSCGKIEGEKGDTKCKFCGNCLREYFSTMELIRDDN